MDRNRKSKYYKKIDEFCNLHYNDAIKKYPEIFELIVKKNFKVQKSERKRMFEDLCAGNWKRLWETDDEKVLKTICDYTEQLQGEIFYCADRMSWDRLIRIHWIYQIIKERKKHGGTPIL